jgi:hypothetical protein
MRALLREKDHKGECAMAKKAKKAGKKKGK